MNWKARLLYSQNWNIGFCEQTPKELIQDKKLSTVRWLKHPYRDRWFADPFIYKITEDEIIVFVEECPMDNPKGILCELHIDRKSLRLKNRHVILKLDTHLSYPAIIEHDRKTYVYPENGASGKLNIYEYKEDEHKLVNPVCILNEAVADSTILQTNEAFFLIATHSDNSQEQAFLYQSKSLFGPFVKCSDKPVQTSRNYSRPAGNWIEVQNHLYRPAQNCMSRYGAAMEILEIKSLKSYEEQPLFHIEPSCFKYNLGTHTLNFTKDSTMAVVDGYGYLHPMFSRIWNRSASFKQKLR